MIRNVYYGIIIIFGIIHKYGLESYGLLMYIFSRIGENERRTSVKAIDRREIIIRLLSVVVLLSISAAACGPRDSTDQKTGEKQTAKKESAVPLFLTAVEDVTDTVDFQRTTIYYTIATNVFNRLVEMEADRDGNIHIVPSLAKSWEISPDKKEYSFHLRENVSFSNGAALTAEDVLYSFSRLLTLPGSTSREIAEGIMGARKLEEGETDVLEGFRILDDLDFVITLEEPYAAFLACLSMPAASIMDSGTTREAGDRFGMEPEWTIGTGPYILREWEAEKGMILVANENCWAGPPCNDGLDLRFLTEPEDVRQLFEKGQMDIIDLDDVGDSAEFFIHGDIYQDRLFKTQRIGIAYIALNESIKPLDNVEVRKALQLSLNRTVLLEAVYGGRGFIENGIYPHALYGFSRSLPEIPYDPEEAGRLLRQAGYPDGFDLTITMNASATENEMTLMRLAASMWEKIGIRAFIKVLGEKEFMHLRKTGGLAVYTGLWTADYNDPENFIYTFFGNRDNTTYRSLCYPREEIMERVRAARTITDEAERLREYQELERIIVQEDAAWIPLFSRWRYYVTSERVEIGRASCRERV